MNGTAPAAPSSIDAAIAATEPRPVFVFNTTLTLPSTGRNVALAVPSDITAVEALELIAYISTELGNSILRAQVTKAGPQLVVPDHGLVVPGKG